MLRELLDLFGSHPWQAGSNVDAATALESILVPGRPVLVLGEPFEHDAEGQRGMHDIHRNHGDRYDRSTRPGVSPAGRG
ncbi:hypothetical protein ABZ871_33105 [Streptomyces populi]